MGIGDAPPIPVTDALGGTFGFTGGFSITYSTVHHKRQTLNNWDATAALGSLIWTGLGTTPKAQPAPDEENLLADDILDENKKEEEAKKPPFESSHDVTFVFGNLYSSASFPQFVPGVGLGDRYKITPATSLSAILSLGSIFKYSPVFKRIQGGKLEPDNDNKVWAPGLYGNLTLALNHDLHEYWSVALTVNGNTQLFWDSPQKVGEVVPNGQWFELMVYPALIGKPFGKIAVFAGPGYAMTYGAGLCTHHFMGTVGFSPP